MLPTMPQNLFPRPFANNGTYQLIPDDKATDGRASFKEGFPVETQLPLSQGGIAPNRLDFNGALYMLSAFAFWQQSGGLWAFNEALDYNPPAIVLYDNELWWCVAPNGPTQNAGVVTPGTDENFWITLTKKLFPTAGGGSSYNLISGYITEFKPFYEMVLPPGWRERNGETLTNADVDYPDLWAALTDTDSQFFWKAKTPAEWAALSSAAGGTGGVPYFAVDPVAKTIRLPDTRGDYEEHAGLDGLTFGGWHNSQNKAHTHSAANLGAHSQYGAQTYYWNDDDPICSGMSTSSSGGNHAKPRAFGTKGAVFVGVTNGN